MKNITLGVLSSALFCYFAISSLATANPESTDGLQVNAIIYHPDKIIFNAHPKDKNSYDSNSYILNVGTYQSYNSAVEQLNVALTEKSTLSVRSYNDTKPEYKPNDLIKIDWVNSYPD